MGEDYKAVMCSFDGPLPTNELGQNVTVLGVSAESKLTVRLEHCEIVEP